MAKTFVGIRRNTVVAPPDTTPPSDVSGLAVGLSGNKPSLTWDAATDNVGVTQYRIERQLGGSGGYSLLVNVTVGLTYLDSSAPDGTLCEYRIKAQDAATNLSTNWASGSVTTPSVSDTTAPTFVLGLTGTPLLPGTNKLEWYAAWDPVVGSQTTSNLQDYRLRRDGVVIQTIAAAAALVVPLSTQLIGTVGQYNVTQDGANWTLESDAAGAVNGTFDDILYVRGTVSGDYILGVKLTSATSANMQAGIMIRQDDSVGSAFVAIIARSNTETNFVVRDEAGNVQVLVATYPIAPISYLLIKKVGTQFSGWVMPDGKTEFQIGTGTNFANITSNHKAGLFTASKTPGTPQSCQLDNLFITNLLTKVSVNDATATPGADHVYDVITRDAKAGTPNSSIQSASVTVTTKSNSSLVWPAHSTQSVVPDATGWGMDGVFGSGRHWGNGTTVHIIDDPRDMSLGSTLVGTRTYRSKLISALAAAGPKTILFGASGRSDYNGGYDHNTDYATIFGGAAPGPGVWLKQFVLRSGGNNQLCWHFGAFGGDGAGSPAAEQRDGHQIGGYYGLPSPKQYVCSAHLSIYFSVDELMEFFSAIDRATIWRCLFGYALTRAGHPDSPHAAGGIIGDVPTRIAFLQCVFAHAGFRMMAYTRGPSWTIANCIAFNSGRVVGDPNWNEWLHIGGNALSAYSEFSRPDVPIEVNVINNVFLSGPNTVAYDGPIVTNGNPASSSPLILPGSSAYISGNRIAGPGWGSKNHADQNQLIHNANGSLPVGFLKASPVTSSYPPGYAPYNIGTSTQAVRDFIALLIDYVGCRPLEHPFYDVRVLQQMLNRLDGTNVGGYGTGEIIASPSQLPLGLPTVPYSHRDLLDSTAMGGDPVPTVENGRDIIQGSGYTKLEEWMRRWHAKLLPAA